MPDAQSVQASCAATYVYAWPGGQGLCFPHGDASTSMLYSLGLSTGSVHSTHVSFVSDVVVSLWAVPQPLSHKPQLVKACVPFIPAVVPDALPPHGRHRLLSIKVMDSSSQKPLLHVVSLGTHVDAFGYGSSVTFVRIS